MKKQSGHPGAQVATARGFTLIELMVAMALGVIVTGGIISLFISTSRANRVQAKLAHIQENGRFAVARLSDDLRMTNAQYCSNTGGPAQLDPANGYVYQANLRAPTVLAKSLVLSDGTTLAAAASASGAYPLPPNAFLSGYECDSSSCTPTAPTSLPVMGAAAGDRVKGADVLTVRYVQGDGWSLDAGHSTQTCDGSNKLTQIVLSPSSSEPPASRFEAGDLAMLADCSQSQVFAVAGGGSNTLTPANNFSGANAACVIARNGGRLFDFSKDFITVTYYLQLKADDNPDAPAGHLVSVLMRKINDVNAEPLVRGVEGFDLRYAVEDHLGRTAYLTADKVASKGNNTLTCPPGAPKPLPAAEEACLWRAVKSVEVNVLLDSVDRMPSLPEGEMAYVYPPAGASIQTPPTTMTNGLDRKMMRRGFTFIVATRNYNP